MLRQVYGNVCHLQLAIDHVNNWSRDNLFLLNPCKELHICFKRKPPDFTPAVLNGMSLERILSDKVLGVTIRSDLKWNDHIDEITTKAAQRLYLLRLLKRAFAPPDDLILLYCCVRADLHGTTLSHATTPYDRLTTWFTIVVYARKNVVAF